MTRQRFWVALVLIAGLTGSAEAAGPSTGGRFLLLLARGDEVFTSATAYATVPGMTGSFTVGGADPTCVVVTFSAQAAVSAGEVLVLRANLDGTAMSGHENDASPGLGIHSMGDIDLKIPAAHTFFACNVAPGSHTVTIRWKSDLGQPVSLHGRTLVVEGP